MESYFEIIFYIGIILLAGVLIGVISTILMLCREANSMKKELDCKSKTLQKYEKEFKDKYVDDNYEAY